MASTSECIKKCEDSKAGKLMATTSEYKILQFNPHGKERNFDHELCVGRTGTRDMTKCVTGVIEGEEGDK